MELPSYGSMTRAVVSVAQGRLNSAEPEFRDMTVVGQFQNRAWKSSLICWWRAENFEEISSSSGPTSLSEIDRIEVTILCTRWWSPGVKGRREPATDRASAPPLSVSHGSDCVHGQLFVGDETAGSHRFSTSALLCVRSNCSVVVNYPRISETESMMPNEVPFVRGRAPHDARTSRGDSDDASPLRSRG